MLFIIRADASQQIASGHIMRCLTLAFELRGLGAMVEFIARKLPGNMNDYIESKGFKVHSLPESDISDNYEEVDANECAPIFKDIQADWLVVDHYSLGQSWEKKLRSSVNKIMVIDDLANREHDCDVLLDQNYFHDQHRYDQLISPASIQLLGPRFALLRKSFLGNLDANKREFNRINKVFVFFGGSDEGNLTSFVLKALKHPELNHLSVDVVIGRANLHRSEVEALIAELPNAALHIQIDNIAELMREADIALGAGGSTTWERMVVGLPCIVVTTAENQIAFIRDLDEDGYINWLGSIGQVDFRDIQGVLLELVDNPARLREQSERGQKLISGDGAHSIAQLIAAGPDTDSWTVRNALDSDCLLYWHWANDPVVRENAFNQRFIEWGEHQEWFKQQLNDPESILVLVECEYGPVGQVRFNLFESKYVISYSIGRTYRGLGIGTSLLKKAINEFQKTHRNTLVGEVRESNLASCKIFKRLGFSEIMSPSQKGVHRFQL